MLFFKLGRHTDVCVSDTWMASLQLMKGREEPHTDKYKEIANDWNYDANCTLTSLPVLGLTYLKSLIFVTQCVCASGDCGRCYNR
jgi:hypothetical protein